MELMNAAGHHITDVLTELAYFSYLSRRAPIRALTHYVRATYVPNEYVYIHSLLSITISLLSLLPLTFISPVSVSVSITNTKADIPHRWSECTNGHQMNLYQNSIRTLTYVDQ